MTSTPQYNPSEILEMGKLAERDGNVDYATRFYSYIVDQMSSAPEAAEARAGLDRLMAAAAGRGVAGGQPVAGSSSRQPAPATSHASPANTAGTTVQTEKERTGPPRLSLEVGARPVRSNTQQPAGVSHRPASPPGTPASPLSGKDQSGRAEPALSFPSRSAPSATPRPEASAPQPPQPASATAAPPQPGMAPPTAGPATARPAWQDQPQAGNLSPAAAHDRPLAPVDGHGAEAGDEEEYDFVPGYRVGRFLAFALVLVGWLALLGGLAFAGMAIGGISGSQTMEGTGGLPFGVVVGIAGFLAGLVMVFLGSMARAVFEAANNTRELLEIERARSGW